MNELTKDFTDDDLRVFSARLRQSLPAYADPVTAASLRTKFRYIFDDDGAAAADDRVRPRRTGPQHEPRPAERGDGHAIGVGGGEK